MVYIGTVKINKSQALNRFIILNNGGILPFEYIIFLADFPMKSGLFLYSLTEYDEAVKETTLVGMVLALIVGYARYSLHSISNYC
jgi:hypothetical protein